MEYRNKISVKETDEANQPIVAEQSPKFSKQGNSKLKCSRPNPRNLQNLSTNFPYPIENVSPQECPVERTSGNLVHQVRKSITV